MNNSELERLRNFKRQQRNFKRIEDNEFRRIMNACDAVEDDPERHKQISKLLEYVANADLDERKSEGFHSRILNSSDVRAIANVASRDDKVDPDEEFREWLAKESLKPLPDDSREKILRILNEEFPMSELLSDNSKTRERLDALEKIHSELAKHFEQKAGRVLNAKATRALAALFPRDFTTLSSEEKLNKFIEDFNKSYTTMEIDPQGSVPRKHRQILERLDEFLMSSPEDDLEKLARRMTLPFRLMDQGYLTPEPLSTDDSDEMTAPQNIILYGPPGTGKTYSTTERALELVLGKDEIDGLYPSEIKSLFRKYQKKGQIEFVTFHQSYGYEEFVEGLRPVLNEVEANDVHYELHAGVFKRIALRAAAEGLTKSAAEQDPDFDYLWDRLVEKIREDSERIVTGKQGGEYVFRISNSGNIKTLRCERDGEDEEDNTDTELNAPKKNSKELWDQRSTFGEDPEHLTATKANEILKVGNHFTALWIVYKRLWELSQESDSGGEERPSDNAVQRALDKGESESFSFSPDIQKTPQYVLIIDEINRGNMSKILGELITLLEPDKRLGADNELRLRLPYSPTHRFCVPPNLHILGTMNTADRSIALMDVALRRRFTFEERMPDAAVLENELTRKLPDKRTLVKLVVDLFNTLNKRIRFLYDRDHQLGHSYFLNVNSLEDLRRVFIDRVIPLLQEYFYGDWYKICTVLGCPYSEDGKKRSDNERPIVKAEEFGEVDTLGFDHDEYEDRVDFAVSTNFLGDKMTDEDLVRTFLGVLQLKGEDFTRIRELTGNGSSSDKEEGGEEEPEDS